MEKKAQNLTLKILKCRSRNVMVTRSIWAMHTGKAKLSRNGGVHITRVA